MQTALARVQDTSVDLATRRPHARDRRLDAAPKRTRWRQRTRWRWSSADRPRDSWRGRPGHVPGRAGVPAGARLPPPGAGRRAASTRGPGTTRYATSVQIAREKELLDATGKEGAPHLTREESARLLGAKAEELEAAALAKATEPTRQLPSGVTLAQAAALHQAMTSDRTGYATVGPAGTGKTPRRHRQRPGCGGTPVRATSSSYPEPERGQRHPAGQQRRVPGLQLRSIPRPPGAASAARSGRSAIKPGTLLLATSRA